MSQKFLTNIDLGQNELISPRIHNLSNTQAGDITTPKDGQIYYSTTDNKIRVYNSTAWVDLGITYDTSVVSSSGIKIRLTGSNGTTDDILVSGSNITVAATDASTLTLSIPQSVATTANPTFAGATLDAVRIGVTAAGEIDTTTGNLTIDSAGGTVTVDDNLVVVGNLTVNGTTTTVNSTTTTLDDPILTLGGDTVPTADDNKDRGVEFRWHNGTAAKVGFFGFEDSSGKFVFKPDATNTSEVFSGDHGTILAGFFEGNGAGITNINADNISSGALSAARGGTGLTGYSIGDILYANGGTSLAKLNGVATGNVLISGGVNTAPSYGKVGLTTHVSGTLPIANGGTNSTATPTNGGIVYGTGSAYGVSTAGTAGWLLRSNGTGAPSWVENNLASVFPDSSYKTAVKVATTANIATTGTQTIDGIAVTAGDRVLVKNQSTQSQNGIYTVSATAWTRSLDADAAAEMAGACVSVDQGTTNGGRIYTSTFKSTDVLNTAAVIFNEIVYEPYPGSPARSYGISITGNAGTASTALNVTGTVAIGNGGTGATTAAAARTNLGVASYKASIGDGTATSFVVTHSLNTLDVIVQLYDDTSVNNDTVFADVQRTNVNYITVVFNNPPTTNQIKVLIMSIAG